jgi:hypothetical protein
MNTGNSWKAIKNGDSRIKAASYGKLSTGSFMISKLNNGKS